MSNSPPRVLLIGRHELGLSLANALHQRGNPLAILPARREDNRRACLADFKAPDVVQFARRADVVASATSFEADIVISAGFDAILKEHVLEALPYAVNVHFGALPRYRGNLSIPWALINGDAEIGVTLHRMQAGIDDGAIIDQRKIPVGETASTWDVYASAVATGTCLVIGYLEALERGQPVVERAQDEAAATYFPPGFPGKYEIIWRQTGRQVLNYIRACHFPPYAGAHGLVAGKRLEFDWPAQCRFRRPAEPPGTIVVDAEHGAGITVLNGIVLPGRTISHGHPWPHFADAVDALALMGRRFAPTASAQTYANVDHG